jgi:PAT family beta-lactamase induction signal transducer AmpG
MAAYGFVSGLPLPLSGFTLRLWLSDSGVPVSAVGMTAWIGLAYSLKFLWAPLLDRMPPAFARFGRRRGWLLLAQPLLCLAVVLLALSQPAQALFATLAAAACVALLSATQDIAIDAWRIETFPARRQGLALAVYVWGYRVALLVATTAVIRGAAVAGWHAALLAAGALVAAGTVVTLFAHSPESPNEQPPRPNPRDAVVAPLRSFLARPRAWMILAFIALFKLGEAMAGIMTAPFYLSLGFDKAAIGDTGPFSLCGTLAGITLGGWLVARLGVGRALLLTGWAQTMAMAMYVVLSLSPGDRTVLYMTVSTEAFAQGVADAAFLTFLSGLCERAFAATQYALLSAVPALAIHTIGGWSGRLADALGWTPFYAVCMAGALPGMGLMALLLRRAELPSVTNPP